MHIFRKLAIYASFLIFNTIREAFIVRLLFQQMKGEQFTVHIRKYNAAAAFARNVFYKRQRLRFNELIISDALCSIVMPALSCLQAICMAI